MTPATPAGAARAARERLSRPPRTPRARGRPGLASGSAGEPDLDLDHPRAPDETRPPDGPVTCLIDGDHRDPVPAAREHPCRDPHADGFPGGRHEPPPTV